LITRKEYIILPQTGIHYEQTLWLEGQVIGVRRGYFKIKPEEHPIRNFIRILRYYSPSKAKFRKLVLKLDDQQYQVQTDKTGYFKIKINLDHDHSSLSPEYELVKKTGECRDIIIPDISKNGIFSYTSPTTGVISDIDDTILLTYVNRFLKKVKTFLTRNAFLRKPVSQYESMYQIFEKRDFSFFYVSNSEYNLFPLIKLFLDYRKFPAGPIYLKPYRKFRNLIRGKQTITKTEHKLNNIQFILSVFPQMNIILIGDDSQADPFIYSVLSENYPDRIKAVFIRQTRHSAKHEKQLLELFDKHRNKLYMFTEANDIIMNLDKII